MKHLRPLNDWSRGESQFEIKGEFLGNVDIEGLSYLMPETSDEVRYVIRDVTLMKDNRLVDILFKEHRNWKGPIYLVIFQDGQNTPLRVVSVLPDNYYLNVYVELPEQADFTQGDLFVVVTNVALSEENAMTEEWTNLGGARIMKRLKSE